MPAAENNKPKIQRRRWRKSSDDEDLNNRPARKQRKRRLHPCLLPHEVVVGNILNRLSVKSLMRFNCVSKLWYDSINKDPNFASFHLNQSLKNPTLTLYVLNVELNNLFRSPLFLLQDLRDKYDRMHDDFVVGVGLIFRNLTSIDGEYRFELVGSCNGLVCLSSSPVSSVSFITITNPSRSEFLSLNLTTLDHGYIVCYGFGFDSLTGEYKVVLIVCTKQYAVFNKWEFKCLIFTLGGRSNNNSWRETSTRPPIGNPPPTEDGIRTRMNIRTFYKSAIFCGGALFWRSRSDNPTAANENMLLSFDLHQEKFEAIPLPAECYSKPTEQQQRICDPLIQFRGSPCVPRIERLGEGCDGRRQHFYCKVHFHILMDKVEKKWIKETFDVHISSSSLQTPLPPYSCCCFYGTTAPTPTRIFSSSDQGVLLYWFNGEYLQFYNLHTKHVKVARCSLYDDFRWVFRNKEHTFGPLKDGRNQLRPMDYHLNHHVENLFSLQTLIPRGAPKLDYDDFLKLSKEIEKPPAGYLFVEQKSPYYYLL